MKVDELVGKSYMFEDGDSLTVMQVKRRNAEPEGCLITFHVQQGPGIPRKLIMNEIEFRSSYGHLFGIEETVPEDPET